MTDCAECHEDMCIARETLGKDFKCKFKDEKGFCTAKDSDLMTVDQFEEWSMIDLINPNILGVKK